MVAWARERTAGRVVAVVVSRPRAVMRDVCARGPCGASMMHHDHHTLEALAMPEAVVRDST